MQGWRVADGGEGQCREIRINGVHDYEPRDKHIKKIQYEKCREGGSGPRNSNRMSPRIFMGWRRSNLIKLSCLPASLPGKTCSRVFILADGWGACRFAVFLRRILRGWMLVRFRHASGWLTEFTFPAALCPFFRGVRILRLTIVFAAWGFPLFA